MSDELENLLSGSDDAFPESAAGDAAHPQAGNGQASSDQASSEQAAAGDGSSVPVAAAEAALDEPVAEAPPKPVKPRPPRPPVEELSLEKGPIKKDWYILKVQSNREDSIADALQRRIAIAGLGDYFGDIVVPTEKVSEFKGGKKRIVKRKIYPGYIVVHMELNDDTWFLVRETPGIGDFTGSGGKPAPMTPQDVAKVISKPDESSPEQIKNVIPFNQGDRVRIKEGTFENFEGDVDNIDPANGRVTIMINIFGRSTPVELEYYQAEKL
ncbi:MAG TPA: transcription termination/antitermination protein NusG [Pirellulales bacterium]